MWRSRRSTDALEMKIELLEAENKRLLQQLKETQEALIAAASPAAYQQNLMRQAIAEEKNDPEFQSEKTEQEFIQAYIREMETPTFHSPDEFIQYTKRGGLRKLEDSLEEAYTDRPPVRESLHGNSES